MNTQIVATFNNKLYYKTYNILKSLGLKSGHSGTKLIIKSVLLKIKQEDIFVYEDVYSIISKDIKLPNSQIRNNIKYAIDNRNKKLSKSNFENIFGYEYDEFLFTNKEFIEELSRVINS